MSLDPFGADVPLLVISPHLDDAVLSAHALLDRTEPADVVTVFTAGPLRTAWMRWDLLSGFADSDEAAAARLDEEFRAFAGTPHRLHHLALRDLQYRGRPAGPQEEAVLVDWVDAWLERHDGAAVVAIPAIAGNSPAAPAGPPTDDASDAAAGPRGLPMLPRPIRIAAARLVWLMLRVALRLKAAWRPSRPAARWAAAARRTGIPVPSLPKLRQPPAAHPDHRFVRDVMWRALAKHPGVTVVLYEELPYSWARGADAEVRELAGDTSRAVVERRVGVDRVVKSRRVGAYRSQMPVLFSPFGPLDRPKGLPADERYWIVQAEPLAAADEAPSLPVALAAEPTTPARRRRPARSRSVGRIRA